VTIVDFVIYVGLLVVVVVVVVGVLVIVVMLDGIFYQIVASA
jgi:hypothetical protein